MPASVLRSRPQLSLEELERLKWTIGGILALLAVWTVLHLGINALGLVLLSTGGIIAGLFNPALPLRIPNALWRLSVPLMIGFFALDLVWSTEVLPSLVRLNILLVLYRSLAPRRRREDLQLLVLGLFLVVMTGVLTISIAFVLQILAFTAFALVYLFLINLVHGAQEGGAAEGDWTRVAWGGLVRRVRAVFDWRLAAFSSGLFVLVMGVSALIFLVIPRFQLQNTLAFLNLLGRQGLTGFSEQVNFGEITDLLTDTRVAMRVEVRDADMVPAAPYWRMVALDEYEDASFRISRGLRMEMNQNRFTGASLRGLHRGPSGRIADGEWIFYVESGVSRYFAIPGVFGMLRTREAQTSQVSMPLHLLALVNDASSMTAYRIERLDLSGRFADPLFGRELADARGGVIRRDDREIPGPGAVYPLSLVALPEGDANRQALRRMVAEITGGDRVDSREFARRAVAWLSRGHGYSMSIRLPEGETDPVVRWLESGLAGHCEYFAGALALLSRTAGIPARVVTGFKGGSWNGFENYFMVRHSDAHAWCELYDEGGTWFRVDPTPGSANETLGQAAASIDILDPDSSWGAYLDSLRMLWYRRIVNFDHESQIEVVRRLRQLTRESTGALATWFEESLRTLRVWTTGPWDWRKVLTLAAVLLGGVLAFLALRVGWRWWELHRPVRRRIDPIRRRAGRWLVRFAAVERANGVEEHLLRLRYGPRHSWPAPDQVFREARRAWRTRARGVRGKV